MVFAGLIAILIVIIQLVFRRQFAEKTAANLRLMGVTPLANVSVKTWILVGTIVSAITFVIGVVLVWIGIALEFWRT